MNKSVNGVVINRNKVANNDIVLTIFTREVGKIRVYANGARSMKSQLAAASQQLILAEFQISFKKDLHKLNSAFIKDAHIKIRENIDRLFIANYILELIDLSILYSNEESEIYDMLVYALKILENIEENHMLKIFRLSFSLKLVKLLGYEMSLFKCVGCGTSQGLMPVINYDLGGVLCKDCLLSNNYEKYSINHVKSLNILLNKQFMNIQKEDINDIIIIDIDNIITKYIEKNVIDRKMKTTLFLNGI